MCKTVQALLSEYVEGALPEEDHRAVSEHLDSGCPECRWSLALEILLYAVYQE